MIVTNELKETTRVTTPVASNTLSVNVFTAPGKTMVGERPKPFGEPLGFDPITSTLIFGEYDAVLVDAMGTVAEALADWVALHNRNLETIYITHAHFDHFYGLSILLDRFPGARAIATPEAVIAMQMSFTPTVERLARRMFPGQVATKLVPHVPYEHDTFTLEGHELRIIEQGRTDSPDSTSLCSVDRLDRRRRRCVQPMPHVRRRHHPREPKELDRGPGPVSGAQPDDGCRRSQEARRARLSLDDPGHQTLPRGLRSAPENRDVRPGPVRSDD
jgi:Metallo-beta-lactamase superfamily